MKLEKIVPRSENFADWYTSVCSAAKLFSYASVKGTINYLPNGWKIWTNIQNELDKRLALSGALNVQLPLFIKTSDFAREKEHIEGFAPEAFLVKNIGNEVLTDPLIVRPTSEVLFSQLFKEQIHSYNDLPLKYNQWCGVYRAEMATRPFLRGSEFFWHELHAMFATKEECEAYTIAIHEMYNDFLKNVCALPVLAGKKTDGEKFAGAVDTYTREVWSQDGQCIQTGTSHFLGTNFSKMYDVTFQDKNNTFSMPYYMSAGITTRIIGDLVVVHGDDKGLVMPFDIAPYQVAILTLFADKAPALREKAQEIYELLSKSYRVKLDDSDKGFGYKISEQEVMGTPFSIAIGPKDIEKNQCMLIRRDNGEKQNVNIDDLSKIIKLQKVEYYKNLYNKAKKHLDESVVEVSTMDQFKKVIDDHKIALAPWGGSIQDEKLIKEQTGATPRCVKINSGEGKICIFTNKPAKQVVYFARAY